MCDSKARTANCWKRWTNSAVHQTWQNRVRCLNLMRSDHLFFCIERFDEHCNIMPNSNVNMTRERSNIFSGFRLDNLTLAVANFSNIREIIHRNPTRSTWLPHSSIRQWFMKIDTRDFVYTQWILIRTSNRKSLNGSAITLWSLPGFIKYLKVVVAESRTCEAILKSRFLSFSGSYREIAIHRVTIPLARFDILKSCTLAADNADKYGENETLLRRISLCL